MSDGGRGLRDDDGTGEALDDLILPFQLETYAALGRLVRLGSAVQSVVEAHDYPDAVSHLLADALAVAGLLSGILKFEGVLTVQTKGDGPVNILVVDVTSDGAMRGYAQFDADAIARAAESTTGPQQMVPKFIGNGVMAITVDQGADTQRYQGIVPLEGATLADCAHDYLRQSAQLEAVIKLASERVPGPDGRPRWRSGGLLLQRMVESGTQWQSGDPRDPDLEEAWRRAVILLGSCTSAELLDPALHPNDLLYRLFNEDGVRVFESSPLVMRCRCSRERVAGVLGSFPRSEIEAMKEGDDVVVTCEFCNSGYRFDPDAIEALYANSADSGPTN